jgi:hypothetical protein
MAEVFADAQLPVIVVSGDLDEARAMRAAGLHDFQCVRKPLDFAKFAHALNACGYIGCSSTRTPAHGVEQKSQFRSNRRVFDQRGHRSG